MELARSEHGKRQSACLRDFDSSRTHIPLKTYIFSMSLFILTHQYRKGWPQLASWNFSYSVFPPVNRECCVPQTFLSRSSLWPYLSSYAQTSSQLYQVLQPFTMQALLASLLGLETPTSLPFGRTSNYCFFFVSVSSMAYSLLSGRDKSWWYRRRSIHLPMSLGHTQLRYLLQVLSVELHDSLI